MSAAVMFGMAIGAPASAQITPLPGTNEVTSRARPGLDAKGLPVGGLRLYPTIDIRGAYDDNIYNSDQLKVADRRLTIDADAQLRSNWSRHSLVLDGFVGIERYDKRHSENNETYRLSGVGRYDVSPEANIEVGAHFNRATEPRGTAQDIFLGGEPVTYRSAGGQVAAFYETGRLRTRVSAALDDINFNAAHVGSARISQDFRDRLATTFAGEFGLLVSPSVTIYGNASYNDQHGDRNAASYSLDSHGIAVLGGVGFEINRLISARASIGYQRQSFAAARFSSISGVTYFSSVLWNPTPLLSVELSARKLIQQSPYLNIAGIVTDTVLVSADYELLRNVLLKAQVGYDVDKFHDANRVDRRFTQRVNARYLVNRYLEAELSYGHRRQTTDATLGRRYNGNEISIAARLKL